MILTLQCEGDTSFHHSCIVSCNTPVAACILTLNEIQQKHILPPQSHTHYFSVPSHRPPYHRAVDGQRAIVQLTDAVADVDVYSIFAPADGGQGVSPHLTIQDGIATQRFDTARAEAPVNDGGFCRQTEILVWGMTVMIVNEKSNGYDFFYPRR